MRPTQLGLPSSGGSIRGPLAAPAVVGRGRFQLQVRSPAALEPGSWRVLLGLWCGSGPKSTAVAGARQLRAEAGYRDRGSALASRQVRPPPPAGVLVTAGCQWAGRGHNGAGRARSAGRPPCAQQQVARPTAAHAGGYLLLKRRRLGSLYTASARARGPITGSRRVSSRFGALVRAQPATAVLLCQVRRPERLGRAPTGLLDQVRRALAERVAGSLVGRRGAGLCVGVCRVGL